MCLAVALAAPGPLAAVAQAGGGARLLFQLRASNGYRVHAIGEGATGALIVSRGRRPKLSGASASVYVARAKTGGRRFEATFGRLGRADLRFRPSGRVTHGPRRRHCRGPDRYTTRYGTFAGSLRFRGEDGYTTARASSVPGRVVTPAVLRCFDFALRSARTTIWDALTAPSRAQIAASPSSPAPTLTDLRATPNLPHLLGGRGRRTVFRASWRRGVEAEALEAVQRGHRRPVFFAGTLASHERLAVVRLALAVGSPADLLASASLGTATLTPPAPFGGEGSFRHLDDGTKDWAGTLAASFPGAPGVQLTGPEFEVVLSRGF